MSQKKINLFLLVLSNLFYLFIVFFTLTARADTINSNVNVKQFGGSNVVTGVGASGAGIPRVTLSNDSTVGTNVNANSALSSRRTVTGSESNLAAPSNSVGVLVECESVNADNLRYG